MAGFRELSEPIKKATVNDYYTYRKFNTPEEFEDLKVLFDQNKIEYTVEEDSPAFDLTFSGGNPFDKRILVKIRQSDFVIVDNLLEEQLKNNIHKIDEDNYLHEFSDEELLEIIEKPDEWNKPDYIAAQEILNKRGIIVSNEKIENLKKERLAKLSDPKKGQTGWIIFGYISAFLGGLFGIFIGWHFSTFKKTLPNGQRVYEYNIKTRKHGVKILFIGIIGLIFWICFKIVRIRNSDL